MESATVQQPAPSSTDPLTQPNNTEPAQPNNIDPDQPMNTEQAQPKSIGPEKSKYSLYYENDLDPDEKLIYLKKLTLTDGTELPDPLNIPDKDWSDDVLKLPDVQQMDLYHYLINTPSEYTKESLKAYKSLQGYNFFICGHVQDVFIIFIKNTEFCYVKSTVLPSQRQGQKTFLYVVWCMLHKSGWIKDANCTCTSGLGSVCSHVGAMLFKITACVIMGLNKKLCTEELCAWKESRTRAVPEPLSCIDFKRPKKDQTVPTISKPFSGNLVGYVSADPIKFCTPKMKREIEILKKIAPDAAVLNNISLSIEEKLVISDDDSEATDSADETDETTLPEPLTALYCPSMDDYNDEIGKARYNKYVATCSQIQYENLTRITANQSENPIWLLQRDGRITASISQSVYRTKIDNPSMTMIKDVMGYKEPFRSNATTHGIKTESLARENYIKIVKDMHEGLKVEETGLHVDPYNPFLAASPDGLVSCTCCPDQGLLEIKCPFKYQEGLSEWRSDKNICPIDENGLFKTKHPYYFQVQHQMMVTERKFCDFFVFSSDGTKANDYYITRLIRDEKFIDDLKKKLTDLFFSVILKELHLREKDPKMKKQFKVYCSCRRPAFGLMVKCDSEKCPNQQYHYPCVQIKRKPKTWICSLCRLAMKKV